MQLKMSTTSHSKNENSKPAGAVMDSSSNSNDWNCSDDYLGNNSELDYRKVISCAKAKSPHFSKLEFRFVNSTDRNQYLVKELNNGLFLVLKSRWATESNTLIYLFEIQSGKLSKPILVEGTDSGWSISPNFSLLAVTRESRVDIFDLDIAEFKKSHECTTSAGIFGQRTELPSFLPESATWTNNGAFSLDVFKDDFKPTGRSEIVARASFSFVSGSTTCAADYSQDHEISN